MAAAAAAAILAGASPGAARRLGRPRRTGQWLAAGLLAGTFAATNLSPAILFEQWSDGRTLGPAIVMLATQSAGTTGRAALLALGVIAINFVAIVIAWAARALPRTCELD